MYRLYLVQRSIEPPLCTVAVHVSNTQQGYFALQCVTVCAVVETMFSQVGVETCIEV
jgi:hypothetical protein